MTGWPASPACRRACRFGDSSQQPILPQLMHIRRCTQLLPIFRHSSQPSMGRGSSVTVICSRCMHWGGAIAGLCLRGDGPCRAATSAGVEVADELVDAARDVVANRLHLGERASLRIGQLPVDVALARNDRARVVTGRDHDIGPVDPLVVEPLRDMVGGVDADLAQRLEYGRVRVFARNAAGRAGLVPAVGRAAEEPLRHQRTTAVADADEEHARHAGSSATTSSPRTNWYAMPPSDAPTTGART